MDREGIALAIFILCMCFLFYGTPDVWDVLHAKVMSLK